MGGLEAPGGAGLRDGVRRPLRRGGVPEGPVRVGVPRDLEPGAGEGRPGPEGEPQHRGGHHRRGGGAENFDSAG